MKLIPLLFYFLSLASTVSAIMMLVSKKPIQSMYWLVVFFFTVSGFYILLNENFLAVINVLIYASLIFSLFLYATRFTGRETDTEPVKNQRMRFVGILTGGSLCIMLIAVVVKANQTAPAGFNANVQYTGRNFLNILFSNFPVIFLLTIVLLLITVSGAIILKKRN